MDTLNFTFAVNFALMLYPVAISIFCTVLLEDHWKITISRDQQPIYQKESFSSLFKQSYHTYKHITCANLTLHGWLNLKNIQYIARFYWCRGFFLLNKIRRIQNVLKFNHTGRFQFLVLINGPTVESWLQLRSIKILQRSTDVYCL